MPTAIAPDLIAFLSRELGVRPERLRPDATLGEDLGVDGGDGWDLMQAFGAQFGVDMTAFVFDRHFGPEAGPSLLHWAVWSLTASWPKRVPITVGDLELARQRGRWQTPDRAEQAG